MFGQKRNILAILSLLLIMSMVLSGCTFNIGSTGSEAKEPIKIGFLGAQTGDVAMLGQSSLKGIKMAVEEINASGGLLDGRQVKLLEDDTTSSKDKAMSIATKYVTQDKVAAIIGDPTTGVTKVAGQIANTNKTVIISPGSTGTQVVEIGPYVFRDTLLDSVAVPATVKYMVQEKGWKNIAIITSQNNDYSKSLTPLFKKAINNIGANIVTEQFILDKDTNFTTQVNNIRDKKPDVIVFTGYYTEGALIMKQVRAAGMKDIVMIGGDGLQSDDFMKNGQDAVEGSIIFVGFSPEQPTPNTQKFIDAFKEKNNNQEPDLFAAQGYDAMMLIAKAIKDSNSADPTVFREKLAETTGYEGVSGTISFQSNREPVKSPVCLLQVKNGKFALLKKVPVEAK